MTEEEFPDQRPSDKAFGEAAAEKAEELDDNGGPQGLSDEPASEQPRAAGKAEPV